MAIRTIGTNANNSLNALLFNTDDLATGLAQSGAALMATLQQGIWNDRAQSGGAAGSKTFPGAFSRNGLLIVPNRGVLQVQPGDVVAYDTTTGWPILISALALASGPYTTVAPT